MTQFSAADPIVILSYARTPMGGMQGVFSDVSATDLGATAVKAAVERAERAEAELATARTAIENLDRAAMRRTSCSPGATPSVASIRREV